MVIVDERIDGGKAFDWGRTSADYAKYRDIYPEEFYRRILSRGIGVSGQKLLDIGTGTGVIPRNMVRYGAEWVGTDISGNQISEAERLSVGSGIEYYVMPAEKLDFPDHSFDAATACQCFWYFKHEDFIPVLRRILKPGGKFLVMVMNWLPFEDRIAGESEKLVLKYSPNWSGAGETVHPITLPDCYDQYFTRTYSEEFRLNVHFTRDGWNGRMKACRGVGASLTPEQISAWEQEHLKMLENYPAEFDILHYAAFLELTIR